jgi:hypothetical protein
MAERKPFLLRLDPETFAALQRWASDDLRSMNGQVEYVLRRALADAGRAPGRAGPQSSPSSPSSPPSQGGESASGAGRGGNADDAT